MHIPPDALAKMTPDQRAEVDAIMKDQDSPRTISVKTCMTPEKMDRSEMLWEKLKLCTRTFVSSSSSKRKMRLQCTLDNGLKMSGTAWEEATNSETIRGSVQMTTTGGDHPISMSSTYISRYLGPDCGDVK